MNQKLFALSLGFGGLILATHHAFANSAQQCAGREAVLAELVGRYGETRHAIGLAGTTAVMELFASTDTGSWTITVTSADGTTCILASGLNYEALAEARLAGGHGA